jgi:tripartite-type tricarboxylate transporter receptor subunit TctC
VKSGTIRAYSVSAAERLASPPEVPTAKEMGVNYDMSIWAGIFAPKGTPPDVVAKLAAALDKALDDDAVKQRINNLGGSIPGKTERTPTAFDAYVKSEIARWAPVLKASAEPPR